MNDDPERSASKALLDAPPPRNDEAPAPQPEQFRGQDLRWQDLRAKEGLLPEHLAGCDLTGAKLPEEIAKFDGLRQITDITDAARKIFIGLLAGCVYSWLVIGTTEDVELIVNTATSPLPIIDTPIPIAGFYVIGAALLAAVYWHLHFYLLRLWRTIAGLPAVFPDGTALYDKADPWLLNQLVSGYFARLRPDDRPLALLQILLSIVLAWGLVPLTLVALWLRYLPRHEWRGTAWLVLLIGLTTLFGRLTFRLGQATLRDAARREDAEGCDDYWTVLGRAVGELRPDKLTISVIFAVVVWSIIAFHIDLRAVYFWGPYAFSIHTYADLRDEDVSGRPEDWTGKDWKKVKRVDLRGRNLVFADAADVFLANADLRSANLQDADFVRAELQGADLRNAKLQGANFEEAQLQGADLRTAELQGTNLRFADLQGADLGGAQLQGADLGDTRLQGANLWGARLQGANLWGARLEGADLQYAQLQGSDLRHAQIQGANLLLAELQGADLAGAQFQAADLRAAKLWRADPRGSDVEPDAEWDLADLRGIDVRPIEHIDTVIAEATEGISDEGQRKKVVERLAWALRTEDRPARPDFPEQWRSHANVLLEPADLGVKSVQLPWDTFEAYSEDLAAHLVRLACGPNVPEAQVQGLAKRALSFFVPEAERLWSKLLAVHLIGEDCPSANALPDNLKAGLSHLAAQRRVEPTGPTALETPSPGSAE